MTDRSVWYVRATLPAKLAVGMHDRPARVDAGEEEEHGRAHGEATAARCCDDDDVIPSSARPAGKSSIDR